MEITVLTPFLEWVSANPGWALAAVFVVAFSESLAVVGLFMPGAALMFGIGTLIGTGTMDLGAAIVWAALGAIAGDGLSFWLGRHFHQHLKEIWPFRRHPELIERSEQFFQRHGGKSILFGRFVGPVRPIIPAVAGMMDMPARRFLAVNLLSAALWAPAYLLPGVVFGASLGLAAEVAGRLVVVLVLLGITLWLAVWASRRALRLLQPRAESGIEAILRWARRHPRLGEVPTALLDPTHPTATGLLLSALVLVGSTGSFLLISAQLHEPGLMNGLDQLVYHGLQRLRTPVADHAFTAATLIGDRLTLGVLFAGVLLWLLLRRCWRPALHWAVAGGFAVAAIQVLKPFAEVARPTDLYQGGAAFSFPSGHTTASAVLLGFLAVMVARELPPPRRWVAYTPAVALVALVGFSRLYLGAHWLSDVLGGAALGSAWVTLQGIAYRRHPSVHLRPARLAAVIATALVAGLASTGANRWPAELARYAPTADTTTMAAAHWWQTGWQGLPRRRDDLGGDAEHPLTLQFAGSLQRLRSELASHGWRIAPEVDLRSWLQWLNPRAHAAALPVLPQVHNGRFDALRLVHAAGPERLLVLRLWRSEFELHPGAAPLYIGNIAYLEEYRPLDFFAVLRTGEGFEAALAQARPLLAPLRLRAPEGTQPLLLARFAEIPVNETRRR